MSAPSDTPAQCAAKDHVLKMIASFDGYQPDNAFQRGYLAALEVVRDEAFSSSDGSTEGRATDGAPSKRTAPVARPDRGAGVESSPLDDHSQVSEGDRRASPVQVLAEYVRMRANGFKARGTSIFNGNILAEELHDIADRLAHSSTQRLSGDGQ